MRQIPLAPMRTRTRVLPTQRVVMLTESHHRLSRPRSCFSSACYGRNKAQDYHKELLYELCGLNCIVKAQTTNSISVPLRLALAAVVVSPPREKHTKLKKIQGTMRKILMGFLDFSQQESCLEENAVTLCKHARKSEITTPKKRRLID